MLSMKKKTFTAIYFWYFPHWAEAGMVRPSPALAFGITKRERIVILKQDHPVELTGCKKRPSTPAFPYLPGTSGKASAETAIHSPPMSSKQPALCAAHWRVQGGPSTCSPNPRFCRFS